MADRKHVPGRSVPPAAPEAKPPGVPCEGLRVTINPEAAPVSRCKEAAQPGSRYCETCGKHPIQQARLRAMLHPDWERRLREAREPKFPGKSTADRFRTWGPADLPRLRDMLR